MRQLVLPVDYDGGPVCTLRGGEYHHLVRVLRARLGEAVEGIDRTGKHLALRVERIDGQSCTLRVEPNATEDRGEEPEIWLFQCLPKARKMDLVVRQAGETGLARVVPVISEHVVLRGDGEGIGRKIERWRRILKEAVQQSGARTIPTIVEPVALDRVPDLWEGSGTGVFFHEVPLSETGLARLVAGATRVAICIGPEGGFSEREVSFLKNAGFSPAYLGPTVLRSETAALYAVAAVRTLLQEMKTLQETKTWTAK